MQACMLKNTAELALLSELYLVVSRQTFSSTTPLFRTRSTSQKKPNYIQLKMEIEINHKTNYPISHTFKAILQK